MDEPMYQISINCDSLEALRSIVARLSDVQALGVIAPEDRPDAGVDPNGLDSRGLPWDGRIHSETRTMNKDGSWRAKRGVNDEAMVKRVEAELRARVGTAEAPPPAPPPPPATGAAPPPPPPPPPATGAAPPPPPPGAFRTPEQIAADGLAAAPTSPTSFPAFMAALAPHLASGKVNDAITAAVMAQLGMAALADLATRPEMVPAAWVMVKQAAGIA